MNNDKFTPGPWYAEKFCIWAGDCFVAGTATGQGDPEQQANALLIAAAPDLLAVLAGCADALREAGKDFAQANKLAARPNLYELHEQAARAAIAKATATK